MTMRQQNHFFHTLKTELVYFEQYQSRKEAESSIFDYIECFYKRKRRHSVLNYLSPVQFELMRKVSQLCARIVRGRSKTIEQIALFN